MARKECNPIVVIITVPPRIVSKLGFSLITIQTQIGPTITSNKKNKFTSAAVINLGAIVTNTKGMATHIIPVSYTHLTLPTKRIV